MQNISNDTYCRDQTVSGGPFGLMASSSQLFPCSQGNAEAAKMLEKQKTVAIQEKQAAESKKLLAELGALVRYKGIRLDKDDHNIVRKFVDSNGDPNLHIEFSSLLMIASASGYADIVETLLDKGADINSPRDDGSPLYVSISYGLYDVATLLIKRGADVNREKSGGWVPLHVAMSELDLKDPRSKALIELLRKRSIDPFLLRRNYCA